MMAKIISLLAGTAFALGLGQNALAIDGKRLAALIESDLGLFGTELEAPLEIAFDGADARVEAFAAHDPSLFGASDFMAAYDCPHWTCYVLAGGIIFQGIAETGDGFTAERLIVPHMHASSFGAYFESRDIRMDPVRIGDPPTQYNGLLTASPFIDYALVQTGEMDPDALVREATLLVGPTEIGLDGEVLMTFDAFAQTTLIGESGERLHDSIAIAGIRTGESLAGHLGEMIWAAAILDALSDLKFEQDWVGTDQLTLRVEMSLGGAGSVSFETGPVAMDAELFLAMSDLDAASDISMEALSQVTVQTARLTIDLPALDTLLSPADSAVLERVLEQAIGTEEDDAAFMDFFETGRPLAIVFEADAPMPVAKLVDLGTQTPQLLMGSNLTRFIGLESAR